MKKKIIISMILLIIALYGTGYSAFAGLNYMFPNIPYSFYIGNVNIGYNSDAENKYAGLNAATVDQIYNSLGASIPTNVLIIAADGQQITNNAMMNGSSSHPWLFYYNYLHAGWVRLRVNSGSTTVGYTVTGEWSPNESTFD